LGYEREKLTKNTEESNTEIKENINKIMCETHKTWHKFTKWLGKTFGEDLVEDVVWEIPLGNGKKKTIKYKSLNELELSKRLVGYRVLEKVEKYVGRHCKDIRVVRCDDSVYSGSSLILIPHPKHGITILFIPQCTKIQNQFFLYEDHYKNLMKALREMKDVYKGSI
jgi:hypothetical protein